MADSPIIKPGQGLGEAPEDGNTYGRKDGEWTTVQEGLGEAPIDGQHYARKDASWEVSPGSTLPAAPPEDGGKYVLVDGEWVILTQDGGVYTGSGVPQAGIINANGDSVIPATAGLVGVWSTGDSIAIDVEVDTVPNTVSVIVTGEENALEVSESLAANIDLIANVTSSAVDGVVFVYASGGATSVILTNVVVNPVNGVSREGVPISEGDLMQQARTHLTGVEPSPNSLSPGQLVVNTADGMMWAGDELGDPVAVGSGGEGGVPEAPVDGTPYSRQDESWVPATGGGGGEANTSSSPAASGEELTMAKSGINLPFKKIVAGTNVTLTSGADIVTIDAAGGSGSGEANTSSTPNSVGEELTMVKAGEDLPFKALIAGSGVVLTPTADSLTIDATGAGGGETNTSSTPNAGGEELTMAKAGADLPFKTLIAGPGVTLTADADSIIVSAADPDLAMDDLSDVSAAAPNMNDILIWDGANYVNVQRTDGVTPEAPEDGTPYSREDAGWVGAVPKADYDAHVAATGIHYPDAAVDGNIYGRQDNAWVEISGIEIVTHISDATSDPLLTVEEAWNDYATRTGVLKASNQIFYFKWPSTEDNTYQYLGNQVGPTWTTTSIDWTSLGGTAVSWGQIIGAIADQTDLKSALSQKGSSGLDYVFKAAVDATDPGAGNVKVNNADQSLATEIYVSGMSALANPLDLYFRDLQAEDLINLNENGGDYSFSTFKLTGPPVDVAGDGTWFTIPVENIDFRGPIAADESSTLFWTIPARAVPDAGLAQTTEGTFTLPQVVDWETDINAAALPINPGSDFIVFYNRTDGRIDTYRCIAGVKDGITPTTSADYVRLPIATFLNDLLDVESVVPDDGERLAWNSTNSQWEPRRSTSALGIVAFNYRWSSPVDASPGEGNLSVDNTDPTLVTTIYINKFSDGGGNPDNTVYLENVGEGDWFNIIARDDSAQTNQYDVIGEPVLVGDVFEIPVAWFANEGAAFGNGDRIAAFIRYTSSGVTDHTDLTSIGTNDHAAIDAHIAGTDNPHQTFLRDLEDVTVDAPPAMNDTLLWDGANWINIPAPAGPQGPQGDPGQDGNDGAPGADGEAVLNGAVAPVAGDGTDGDFWINTATNEIWGPKAAGAWPAAGVPMTGPAGAAGADGVDGLPGDPGTPGVDGNTVLYGAIPPTTEGVDGDFYIDTATNMIYGPKAAGVWPAGTSLIGPQGVAGTDGADGATGPAGPTAVSVDAGNQAVLGTDSLLMVPDFSANKVINGAGATSIEVVAALPGTPVATTIYFVTG